MQEGWNNPAHESLQSKWFSRLGQVQHIGTVSISKALIRVRYG